MEIKSDYSLSSKDQLLAVSSMSANWLLPTRPILMRLPAPLPEAAMMPLSFAKTQHIFFVFGPATFLIMSLKKLISLILTSFKLKRGHSIY